MKLITKISVLFVGLLLFSCNDSPKEEAKISEIVCEEGNETVLKKAVLNQENLNATSPLDYLNLLACVAEDGTPSVILFMYRVDNKWVTKEHVTELMKLINSTQPARRPWSSVNDGHASSNSTIGIEAMQLIELYKDSNYVYPTMTDGGFITAEAQVTKADELRKWWESQP